MNSAIVAAFAAILAVANAGYLAAPAVAYSSPLSVHNAYAVSHSTGIVRGAPLIAAHPAHALVRIARGAVYSAPLAYAAAPAVYAAPAVTRTYHGAGIGSTGPIVYGGVPHIRVARGLLAAGPVAYSAPVAYAAPAVKTVAYAAPVAIAAPAVKTVAYAAPVAIAAPAVKTVAYSAVAHPAVAYAAHPAVSYAAHPLAYGVPAVKAVHAAPVLL